MGSDHKKHKKDKKKKKRKQRDSDEEGEVKAEPKIELPQSNKGLVWDLFLYSFSFLVHNLFFLIKFLTLANDMLAVSFC